MIGFDGGFAIFINIHFVGIFFTGQFGGVKTTTDFNTFGGIDRHHRTGQFIVQFAIHRRTPSGGDTHGTHFDHGPNGAARFADAVQVFFPDRNCFRVRAEERIVIHFVPIPIVRVDLFIAHLHHRALDLNTHAQNFTGQGTGGHTAGRFTGRRTATTTIIADAVFFHIGIIRVSRAEFILDVAVILGSLIGIFNHQTNGGAGGHALEHTGHDFHFIRFATLRSKAVLTRFAFIQKALNIAFTERNARRHAVHNTANCRAVAFAPGGYAEQMAIGIV